MWEAVVKSMLDEDTLTKINEAIPARGKVGATVFSKPHTWQTVISQALQRKEQALGEAKEKSRPESKQSRGTLQ